MKEKFQEIQFGIFYTVWYLYELVYIIQLNQMLLMNVN